MDIVALAHNYLPHVRGGAEIMLHELMLAMADRGHNVTVIVTEAPQGQYTINGVNVHCGRAAVSILKRSAFDVVVSHLKEYPRAYSAGRTAGARIVNIVHNDSAETRANVALSADMTVCNTEWLRKDLGLDAIVVHPPVYPERHATQPGDRVTLVNMIPEKGSATFYAVARRMPQVQFLAVLGGYGRQDIKPANNIMFSKNTPNMRRDVWSKTGILLMPSSYESYGMVGVEAMASGIPVIAHPTPGLRESLGDAGIFVDRDDIDGWVSAIQRLRQDNTEARSMALARSAQINTDAEVSAFCSAVEALA